MYQFKYSLLNMTKCEERSYLLVYVKGVEKGVIIVNF